MAIVKEQVFMPPPWWEVLEQWGLVDPNPERIAARVRRIERNQRDWRGLHHQLMAHYPLDTENPNALYDPALIGLSRPMMRHVGYSSAVEGSLDPAVRAGCFGYATVVVADPIWIAHRVFKWWKEHPLAGYTAADTEGAVLRWTTFTIESYLSHLIPLAKEGIIAFDSLWGPKEMNWCLTWDPLPVAVDDRLRAMPTEELEVVAETVWASIRARTLGASVGTADGKFADVLRVMQVPGSEPRRAVEVPILMPFVGPLPVPVLVTLRKRHEDTLAQFRASLAALTHEIETTPMPELRRDRLSEMVQDHLSGDLAKLEREWNAVRIFRYGAAAASGTSLITAAAAIGVSGAHVLPIASATVAALAGIAAVGMDVVRLKANDHYILWRAARHEKARAEQV